MNAMIDLNSLFFAPEWGFLRFAILIGICISPALGIVGTMVVTRRISSLAGASTHAALGGFGLALFLQRVCMLDWFTPTLGAVIGAVSAAVAVGIVSIYAKEREDTVIGAVWAIGMSIGLLFLDRTPGYVDWQGYLFGSILLLTEEDLYMTLLLDAVILIPTLIFFPAVLAMSFDDTFAKLRGIKVSALYLGLLILTALTIVLLINLVGIMLVIALLTLPAAAAACYTSHLRTTMILSAVFNALFITSGLLLSCILELPSGPTIVVLSGIIYAASMIWKKYHSK
jgi:zinc transport system permease protein